MRPNRAICTGRCLLALCTLITWQLSWPALAHAQGAGTVGLAVRAPQSVGVIVNLTDSFAVIPSVDVAWSSSRSEFDGLPGVSAIEHSQTGASLTLAARIRLAASGGTAVYAAPSYSRSVTSNDDSFFATAGAENDYAAGGHIGVQHALTDRVSVFGEVGARYRHYRISTNAGIVAEATTYKSINTSSAVGIVYYFKR